VLSRFPWIHVGSWNMTGGRMSLVPFTGTQWCFELRDDVLLDVGVSAGFARTTRCASGCEYIPTHPLCHLPFFVIITSEKLFDLTSSSLPIDPLVVHHLDSTSFHVLCHPYHQRSFLPLLLSSLLGSTVWPRLIVGAFSPRLSVVYCLLFLWPYVIPLSLLSPSNDRSVVCRSFVSPTLLSLFCLLGSGV
jgi:hypothetical protein